MKINIYVRFIYFIILIAFPLIIHNFGVRPNIKKISLTNKAINNFKVNIVNFDNKIDKSLKKRLALSETYILTDINNTKVGFTYLSEWSKNKMDLRNLSNQIPELIIKSNNVKRINNNNYALGVINDNKVAQACVDDLHNFHYDNFGAPSIRYSDISSWFNIVKKSLKNNILFYSQSSNNCLLITSTDQKLFEKDLKHFLSLVRLEN